jgi:hypothetical protein
MTPAFPARVHVLLAREAPYGVVIRRGPTRRVCTLGWNLADDTFTLGQWLSGRIYARRSDLSPDGRYLIYFALNGRWTGATGGTYTALSRAPYLKAMVLWGKGDCWNGGGLFTGPNRYWLNELNRSDTRHTLLRDSSELARHRWFRPVGGVGAESLSGYFPRLLRDGWRLVGHQETGREKDLHTFERALPGGWALRKLARSQLDHPPGKGCYWDEHALVHEASGRTREYPDWEWAEWRDGRLLWAAGGRIFAARLDEAHGPTEERELIDLNGMTFERRVAPY